MTAPTQAEALALADLLETITFQHDEAAVATIRAQAARIAELEAQVQPAREPLTDERIRQLDDETHFHESHDWSVRFARRVEAEVNRRHAP